MNSKISLKAVKFPKVIADLSHSNQFLKVFSISTLGLLAFALVVILVLSTKEPVVLTLTPTGERLQSVSLPKPEDEIKAAVARYLEKRYRWEPQNVKERLSESESFVLPTSRRAFQGAVSNVIRFSTEKFVSQSVYANELSVDLSKKIVLVRGDRITAIQGMKAVGNLKLELTFESGPRTKENPWGIYVTKEREEQQ